MKRAVRLKLRPNKNQRKWISRGQDLGTLLSNYATEFILKCDEDNVFPSAYRGDYYKFFSEIMEKYPPEFFADFPSPAKRELANSIPRMIDKIISERKKGKPARARYRSNRSKPLFIFSDSNSIQIKGNRVTLTNMKEGIPFFNKGYVPDPEKDKISHSSYGKDKFGNYWLNLIYEKPQTPLPKTGIIAGLNWGVRHTLSIKYSNGEFDSIHIPQFKDLEEKKKILQRKYGRQVERRKKLLGVEKVRWFQNSYRMKETLKRIAILSFQIAKRRAYWLEQTALYLVRKCDHIIMDDLSVQKITKKGKKGFSRKMEKRFNKKALHSAPYLFKQKLKNKCEEYGKILSLAEKYFPSTKKCMKCGHINPSLNLSELVLNCEKCGFSEDREVNASTNLGFLALQGSKKGVELTTV